MKYLIFLFLFLPFSSSAQEETKLEFKPMEVADILTNAQFKSLKNVQKTSDKDIFLVEETSEKVGPFLIKRDKTLSWIAYYMEQAPFDFELFKFTGNFITYTKQTGGSSLHNTWRNEDFYIINIKTQQYLNFITDWEHQDWTYPEQRKNESSEKYEIRMEKEVKIMEETFTSTVKFDGKWLNIKRVKKGGNTIDCIPTGIYELIGRKFVKKRAVVKK